MKTPEETKKGLECCISCTSCSECPYTRCGDNFDECAIMLIHDAFDCFCLMEAKDIQQAQRIAQLEQELAAAKRERDAAVADMRKMATGQIPCVVCSNDHRNDPVCKSHQGDCSECSLHCPCDGCFDDWAMELTGGNFVWRGVCPDTEVQEDD